MIGIMQNKNLTSNNMKHILERHLKNVIKRINSSHTCKEDSINNDINKFFTPDDAKSFDDIVSADYKKLIELRTQWDIGLGKGLKPQADYINLYERWRTTHGNELVVELELTVCPYCNRNHINGAADFDHFFPKDKYPIFALSLYNLIPVCPACNRLKNNKTINISPYDMDKKTDDLITFSWIPKSSTIYQPIIKPITAEMATNIAELKLEEAYSIHTELIAEIMYKATKYNEAYIHSLYEIMGFAPKIEFVPKEFYYNNYLSQENYYKRALSKLTRDLVCEFER